MAIKSILLKNNEKIIKKSMGINESTFKKWDEFITKNNADKNLLLTAALENFIEEYEENKIEVLIKL